MQPYLSFSPMLFRVLKGMFNMNYSCVGDPGIGFGSEFSLRTWWSGYQVMGTTSPRPCWQLFSLCMRGQAEPPIRGVRRTERSPCQVALMSSNFKHQYGTLSKSIVRAKKTLAKRRMNIERRNNAYHLASHCYSAPFPPFHTLQRLQSNAS